MNTFTIIIVIGVLSISSVLYWTLFVQYRKKLHKLYFKIAHIKEDSEQYYSLLYSKDGRNYKDSKYLTIHFCHILCDETIALFNQKFKKKQEAIQALQKVTVKLGGQNLHDKIVTIQNKETLADPSKLLSINTLIQEETSLLSEIRARYDHLSDIDQKEELPVTAYTRGQFESHSIFLMKLRNLKAY